MEQCCLCLNALNVSFIDLFTMNRDGLNHFDKISSCLSQLANILKENLDHHYKLCTNCCDTIDMVYRFNSTCLHNVEIFLSQKDSIKTEPGEVQYDSTFKSNNKHNWKENEKLNKAEDVSILTEMCQIEMGNVSRRNIAINKKLSKRKHKKPNTEDTSNNLDHSSLEELDIEEEDSSKNAIGENTSKPTMLLSNDSRQHGESSRKCKKSVKKKSAQIDKKEFGCEVCGKMFSTKIYLNRHSRVHSDSKPYICDFCGRTFKYKLSLTCHIRTHTGEKPYECDTCKAAFNSHSTLAIHKRIHNDVRPFTCDLCGKKFRSLGNFNKHKQRHTGIRPFECNMCEKTFKDKRTLEVHILSHTGEKPCPCEICGKYFLDKSTVKRHIRHIHEGEKRFTCEFCTRPFAQQVHLKRHIKRIHK